MNSNYPIEWLNSTNQANLVINECTFYTHHGGFLDNRKSASGYFFMQIRGVIFLKCAKQILTIISTMEAEYIACFEATL